MITYIDLKTAINNVLSTVTVDGKAIDITSRDVTEGFIRPSFFVHMETTNSASDENQRYRELAIQIYYFPSDRYEYSIEVLEVMESLENAFDLKLKVGNRYLNIDDPESMIVDGVLNYSFNLEFHDGREFTGLVSQLVNVMKYGQAFYDEYPVEVMETVEIKTNKE